MPRPPRPWFRFYSETLTSRKAQDLGRDNPDLFVSWVNLLCLANVTEPRGSLPPTADIAFALRKSEDEALSITRELRDRKFLDMRRGRLELHQWEDWQKDSDARRTEGRKRRDSAADAPQNNSGTTTDAPHRVRVEVERERELEKEGEKRVEVDAPADAPPAHPFSTLYSQKYRDANNGRILKPIVHGRALSLEQEYGAEACIQVAEAKGWDKDPSYYVGPLEDRKNGTKQLQAVGNHARRGAPGGVIDEAGMADAERYKRGEID